MEDNKTHIDQSLNRLLSGLEAQPDEGHWNKLNHYLEHVQNPSDMGLNMLLGDFELNPPEHLQAAVLDNHLIQTHVIDLALKNTLDQLEDQGSLDLDHVLREKKKKRRLLPFLLLGLLALSGTYFIVHNKSNNDLTQTTILSGKTDSNPNPQIENGNRQVQPHEQSSQTDVNPDLTFKKQHQNGSSYSSNTPDENTVEIGLAGIDYPVVSKDEDIEHSMDLRLFGGFTATFENEYTPKEKLMPSITRLVRIPFQFGIWTGYYFEDRSSLKSDANYVPKDGDQLMNQGNAVIKTGKTIQIDIRYRINHRIGINAGIQYSNSQATSQFNYTYSDIPVFDSTGRLEGYIYRSPQVSPHFNQTVSSTSQSVNVPVNLNIQLFHFGAWQLFGGLGTNLQLLSKGRYMALDYEKGQLQTRSYNQGMKINPNAQLNLQYALSPMFRLGFGYRMAYRSIPTAESDKHFKGREFGNSIQIGIIFQPLIKKK